MLKGRWAIKPARAALRRAAALAVVLAALVAIEACASPGARRPVTVAVRDVTTRQPVAGALVEARSVHLYWPLYPNQVIDSTSPLVAKAITDDAGLARLTIYEHYPVQVLIDAPGRAPLIVYLDQIPAREPGDDDWRIGRLPEQDDAAESDLEVQFRP